MQSSISKCDRKGDHILKVILGMGEDGFNPFMRVRIDAIFIKVRVSNRGFQTRVKCTINVRVETVVFQRKAAVTGRAVRWGMGDRRIWNKFTRWKSSGLLLTSRAPYKVLRETTAFTKGKPTSGTLSNTILRHECVVGGFVKKLSGGSQERVVAVQNEGKGRMTKSVPCNTKLVLNLAINKWIQFHPYVVLSLISLYYQY